MVDSALASIELPQASEPPLGMEGSSERIRFDADSVRLEALVRREFAPVWRLLRRMGLEAAEADDATQQVFIVAARRLGDIVPERERSFLFSTAVHVGQKAHRKRTRLRETGDDALDGLRGLGARHRRAARPAPSPGAARFERSRIFRRTCA